MSTKLIVNGEASETDSDEEQCSPKLTPLKMPTSIQGAVVTGEDSESENENNESMTGATLASPPARSLPPAARRVPHSDSLLHRKLRDSNRDLHRNLEAFAQRTVTENGEKLNSIDQQLLKSQLTLQNALTSLRSLNNNSIGIRNKLRIVLSSKFLANVNNNT